MRRLETGQGLGGFASLRETHLPGLLRVLRASVVKSRIETGAGGLQGGADEVEEALRAEDGDGASGLARVAAEAAGDEADACRKRDFEEGRSDGVGHAGGEGDRDREDDA